MRLGVPFIAPRQLGVVESKSGRSSLPSVIGRTGQSGAHRTVSGARFLSLNGEADRCRSGSRWRTGQFGAPFRPLARPRVARRIHGRPLAHRTVRCTPDSPVTFSRTPSANSRERQVHPRQPGAPDTVRCTTGQSGAPDRDSLLAVHSQLSSPLLLSVSIT
jgi:hypothetical protein